MTNAITLKTRQGLLLLVPIEMLMGSYVFTIYQDDKSAAENSFSVYMPIGRG